MSILPKSNLSRDILLGKDQTIEFEDFLSGKKSQEHISLFNIIVDRSEAIEQPFSSLAEVELMGFAKAL